MFYTGRGDDGKSSLFNRSQRIAKDHNIYQALGDLDECNVVLGLCRTYVKKLNFEMADVIDKLILQSQEHLFVIQAEIGGSDKRLDAKSVSVLEEGISLIQKKVTVPNKFIIAGNNEVATWLDYARVVSRRAERSVIGLQPPHQCSTIIKSYLNRLSSLMYALARWVVQISGEREQSPQYLHSADT